MELNFPPPKDSKNYDDPWLPLVKFIIKCTRSDAITSTNSLKQKVQGLTWSEKDVSLSLKIKARGTKKLGKLSNHFGSTNHHNAYNQLKTAIHRCS